MRIGMLGTCQAQGYAACVAAFLPEAEVRHFFINACDAAEVHALAADCDLFLVQPREEPEWGELRTSRLPQRHLAVLPNIVFAGFHPDLALVPEWGFAHSAMGGYHSALMAACYCLGVPADRVPALFNRYVFAALGYLDEYGRSRRFLIDHCAALGYDVAALFETWTGSTRFMHTINHPNIRVMFDLVRLCLLRAGLIDADAAPALPEDALAVASWPVYDCVAEEAGVAADPVFTLGIHRITPAEFTERSYAGYAAADQAVLERTDSVARVIATLKRIGLR